MPIKSGTTHVELNDCVRLIFSDDVKSIIDPLEFILTIHVKSRKFDQLLFTQPMNAH